VHGRQGGCRVSTALLRSVAACGALTAALVVGGAGCGSDEDEGTAEAEQVLEDIQSLAEGEILIKGSRSPQVYGPYDFEKGGYGVRFEHGAGEGSPGRLVVRLSSQRDAEGETDEPTIDSTAARGTATVTAHGRLYVAVRDASDRYVIRFTPRG